MTRRQEVNITSHIEFFGFMILSLLWKLNGEDLWLSNVMAGLAVFTRVSYHLFTKPDVVDEKG